MLKLGEAGYNERLFRGGVRGWFHLARFRWLRWATARFAAPCSSVIELGCYDGRSIGFLPQLPARYAGFDADWEGGLALAEAAWAGREGYTFHRCAHPAEIARLVGRETFDIGICLETLEHVPPELVGPFLAVLAQRTRRWLFITVPNEKGPVFLVKHLVKRLFGDAQPFSLREVLSAAVGRTRSVRRDDHKGFDYAAVIDAVAATASIRHVSGYPVRWLPRVLGFGVGIVAVPGQSRDDLRRADAPGSGGDDGGRDGSA